MGCLSRQLLDLLKWVGRSFCVATGQSYHEAEESKVKMVVVKAECSYIKPAHYDDLLTLETRVPSVRASLEHEYKLYGLRALTTGRVRLVTVRDDGKIVPIPEWVRKLSPQGKK